MVKLTFNDTVKYIDARESPLHRIVSLHIQARTCLSGNFETREQSKKWIFEYIEVWYNRERIHSITTYMSPVEYERRYSHGLRIQAS
ncbi:IS3 family transposase [Sulfoacidibacillus ferrooxidans]|uniref:IS3 family transposase n=1 Tax=Sulfoacidibacillus ferrooxidans TaxID=2005001 RepID=UPI003AFB617D